MALTLKKGGAVGAMSPAHYLSKPGGGGGGGAAYKDRARPPPPGAQGRCTGGLYCGTVRGRTAPSKSLPEREPVTSARIRQTVRRRPSQEKPSVREEARGYGLRRVMSGRVGSEHLGFASTLVHAVGGVTIMPLGPRGAKASGPVGISCVGCRVGSQSPDMPRAGTTGYDRDKRVPAVPGCDARSEPMRDSIRRPPGGGSSTPKKVGTRHTRQTGQTSRQADASGSASL